MGWFGSLFGKKPKGVVWLEGGGEFECEVFGESNYQAELNAITGGKTEEGHEFEAIADLVREPDNPHDADAIMVMIEDYLVGYLSRPHAAALVRALDRAGAEGARANALIVGGWTRSRKREGHYGVRLDIPL